MNGRNCARPAGFQNTAIQSPANIAIYLAFCSPGDTVMGLSLPHGGHLSHGWSVNLSGKFFNAVHYEVDRETHRLDMDQQQ